VKDRLYRAPGNPRQNREINLLRSLYQQDKEIPRAFPTFLSKKQDNLPVSGTP
jgi:hypothetical protein